MSDEQDMIHPATWQEFRNAGLLWWTNRILHIFGWAIVVDEELEDVYPARVRFRGFGPDSEERGFERLTQHISDEMKRIKADVDEQGSEEEGNATG